MRIGYHMKERYVQRVLKMGHLDKQQLASYISAKLDDINDGVISVFHESSFIFRKYNTEEVNVTSTAYYYHESGFIIVVDESIEKLVTMFEPELASVPPGLRSKDVVASMAATIAQQFQQLESTYEKVSKQTADLTTRREILLNQIEQMKSEMQRIDDELKSVFKPYELEEKRVLEMGAFLVDNRGRVQDEEVTTSTGI